MLGTYKAPWLQPGLVWGWVKTLSLLPKPLDSVSCETGVVSWALCDRGDLPGTWVRQAGLQPACGMPVSHSGSFLILHLQLIMMQPDSCFTLFLPLLAQGEGGITEAETIPGLC